MKEHFINLVVGDPGGDGHRMSQAVTIKCNLDRIQLEVAYDKGARESGFDPSSYVCTEYAENKIYGKHIQKLRDLGFDVEAHFGEVDDDEVCLDPESFCEIYMFVAYLGNKDLVWEYSHPQTSRIDVGGYGLFGD